jgi:DNA-binding YbaB/EbfC family protein
MSRFDQAKMALQAKKAQKELQKLVITSETGDGAVKVEMNGEQKLKKIHIDPEYVDLDDIGQLERWIEDAVREASAESAKVAAAKMRPFLEALGLPGM